MGASLQVRISLTSLLEFYSPLVISLKKKNVKQTYCYSIIMSDDVSDVKRDVGRWFQNFQFQLHVTEDAEVTVDEGLKFDQVMKRPQGGGQPHVQGLCGWRCCC